MNLETNRLNTFANWPASAPVDPIRIAKAGFFYTGEGTEVQCFSCGGIISEWNYGDQVMWRHRQMDPNCAFVVSPQLSGNVPLVLGQESRLLNNSELTERSVTNDHEVDASRPSDYGVTDEDLMFRNDSMRLLSFVNWEDTSVSREALVNAGFYHAGEGRLRCAWCGGELAPFRCFGALGPPLEVHRMYFPRCAYAADLELSQRSNDLSPPSSPPTYTPPLQSPQNENEPQSSGAAHNSRILSEGGTWRALGVVGGSAKHPNYANLAARLATFDRWPSDRTQSPRALADAGFYYTGTDDQVRCFYCDGGLGKWEAGDAPWTEHAFWFSHCGYILLVKGQEFIDACRNRPSVQRTQLSAESGLSTRRRLPGSNFPITESQVEECMESGPALAALGAGLDAARVRRAVTRRLRATGLPFSSSEALIDAVLDDQLNEEAWSVNTQSQRLANNILASCLDGRLIPPFDTSSDSSTPPRSPSPRQIQTTNVRPPSRQTNSQTQELRPSDPRQDAPLTKITQDAPKAKSREESDGDSRIEKKLSLEEENRQLKEARLCKVCMDSEVSVVFLPCGHLVSCAGCSAALSNCPLCRGAVKALVRAYLA